MHPLAVITCLVVIVVGAVYLWTSHAQGCQAAYWDNRSLPFGCWQEEKDNEEVGRMLTEYAHANR